VWTRLKNARFEEWLSFLCPARWIGSSLSDEKANKKTKGELQMRGTGKYLIMAAVCFCLALGTAHARDLKVSLPFIPPLVESKDKGFLVDLLKAMAEEYKGGTITWDVFPFPRSMENVEKGRADFHMPYIKPANPERIPFQYSSEVLFKVIMVLYTNKNNKDINPSNLTKYKIETNEGAKYVFDSLLPNITGSPSIESSLQKVSIGRLDGWLFAMPESDMVLKKLDLKNIKRWQYKKYDVKALLPVGAKGKETDKIVSDLIKKLKANGKYHKIMGPILDQTFEDWQM
jgi:polar amino acid transport system substrate-binding protein